MKLFEPLSRPKFAIVREDPEVERHLIERFDVHSVVLVASGGCTLLTLAHAFPHAQFTAYDFNPRQLQLVRDKITHRADALRFNVRDASPSGLDQRGEFEGLFRTLRGFLLEFVITQRALEVFFEGDTPAAARAELVEGWFRSSYWRDAFRLAFDHGFLDTMFTPAATQHAEPGSYPRYFQGVFERTLSRPDAHLNPFLQHVLLGYYVEPPAWMSPGWEMPEVEFVQGGLPDVPDLARFDLIHVSNIFDWSSADQIEAWCHHIKNNAKRGAVVLLRQLNNHTDLSAHLRPEFLFDDELGAELTERSRIQFYNRITVGVKQ